ncbi:MAG: UDP-N-acetylglucosamine--N-acetylmuramyl-(pentapeptide) pyrophosphoryl-undecaprenol N-acetylglucosamine transferase [Firmicutes bacterium]|nr:UDP-N-acetylglucosamine--N-acetylmuramyl-(pentapeptide) pyrophosphoryl-undecaprenol N-acetylglucosamine transferase [Bacillota bacterium]
MIRINDGKSQDGRLSIVFTGGGTAGHVVPNLAIFSHLRGESKFNDFHYIGSKSGIEKEIVSKNGGIRFHGITCEKFRRSLSPKNILIPFKVIKGISEAKKILKEISPKVVFSKGGFVTYPVVRAAKSLRIPIVIHESDISMGLANKMSAKHAHKILTSFEKTRDTLYEKFDEKVIHTGSPIRREIFQGDKARIYSEFEFDKTKKNLLVIGGSLGAARLNESVSELMPEIWAEWNVLHVTGRGKMSGAKFPNYTQVEYMNEIWHVYDWADVVISRAGSNSVFELMALGKACIFIPLSTGRGDQIENIQVILEKNCGLVLFEENLTKDSLYRMICNAISHKNQLEMNARVFGGYNGIQKIINILYCYA